MTISNLVILQMIFYWIGGFFVGYGSAMYYICNYKKKKLVDEIMDELNKKCN